MAAIVAIFLLPNLATSQPDKGKLSIDPTGNANKTPPSAASFKCSLDLRSGIRLAQLAKLSPAIKKKAETAARLALIETAVALMGANMVSNSQSAFILQRK